MSNTLLRLAPLSLSLSLVACAGQEEGSESPVTSQETAAATGAVEGMVVAMAPITSANVVTIAASYRATFGLDGLRCATVDTDSLTFVKVTFGCQGLLNTSGDIRLTLTSPTTFTADVDLTIAGIAIDASLDVSVPAAAGSERTLDGELSIEGASRSLEADVHASWTAQSSCATYSASGGITATGPHGTAEATFDVDAKTVCHP
jgi:hypothetical protein